MAKTIFSPAVRERVMLRAYHCCEYCKSQDKYSPNLFTIDHLVPQNMGGDDVESNLAYACFLCNRLKSNKLNAFDMLTETWVSLFNPRLNIWSDHFSWNQAATEILPITPIGRVTIATLKLNREKLIEYRKSLILFGVHPPSEY